MCDTCPKGKWRRKCDDCKNCPLGRYGFIEDQTRCTFCGVGMFAGREGMTECSLCPKGFSAPLGAKQCYRCPVGRFTPPIGQTIEHSSYCTLCPSGWKGVNYESDYGKAFLVNRSVYPPNEPSVEPDLCEPCEIGHFSDNALNIFAGINEAIFFEEISVNGFIGSGKDGTLQPKANAYGGVDPVCPLCALGTDTYTSGQSKCLNCQPVSMSICMITLFPRSRIFSTFRETLTNQ